MPHTARTWKPLDHAAIDYFNQLRNNTTPRPTYRTLGEALGVSHNRILKLLNKEGTPLTLCEFTALCTFFHLQSSTVINMLEKQTSTTAPWKTNPTEELTEEERRTIMLTKLHQGDLSLAANTDPYKELEMEGGDER